MPEGAEIESILFKNSGTNRNNRPSVQTIRNPFNPIVQQDVRQNDNSDVDDDGDNDDDDSEGFCQCRDGYVPVYHNETSG